MTAPRSSPGIVERLYQMRACGLQGYHDPQICAALREAQEEIERLRASAYAARSRDYIAETIWRAEFRRATGKERSITWHDVAVEDRDRYLFLADAILSSLPSTNSEGAA